MRAEQWASKDENSEEKYNSRPLRSFGVFERHSPPETRPIRRHTIQVSFTQQLPPKIYCGASLILLLRFCTVLTLTANSVFSINAGLNTSASVKRICRAGAGLLSFILKI